MLTLLKQTARLSGLWRQARLSRQSIGVKLFIFTAVLILIPLSIVGGISYRRSAIELENEAREYNRQVAEQVESHIEYYIRDFESNALKIMNHPDMLQFLRMTSQEQIAQSHIRQDIERLLKNAAYSRADISNITIVLDKMQVIDCYGAKSPYPADELSNEYWYHSVPNAVPIMVSRVISWPDRKEPVLSLVKRVHSPNTLEPIGLLIIDINFRRIQDIAQGVNVWRNGQFFILDSQGHYVYHRNEDLLGRLAAVSYLGQLYQEPEGSFVGGDASSLTTFSYSYYLNWKFVTTIPYGEISKRAAQVGQTTALTAVGALALAYLLGIAFARTIVLRPLRRLQRYMKSVEVGHFNEKIVVESEDEIGELTRGFNRMTERLSALMEEVYFSKLRETESMLRQKEMELKLLQSQVDPHFLTNSLETIRGMALAGGNEEVASMAALLGTLLRYNLRNTAPMVTLREELHFCQVYLQIQEYRFGKQCDCRYIIPDWSLELPVVKFSLQPLLENCLLHGRWPDGRPLAIRIEINRQQQDFVIGVIDNGVGMAAAKLEELRVSLQNADPGPAVGSIGLRNLHRRIVNLFGDSYGLSLASGPEAGTTVTIRLPAVKRQLGSDRQGDAI